MADFDRECLSRAPTPELLHHARLDLAASQLRGDASSLAAWKAALTGAQEGWVAFPDIEDLQDTLCEEAALLGVPTKAPPKPDHIAARGGFAVIHDKLIPLAAWGLPSDDLASPSRLFRHDPRLLLDLGPEWKEAVGTWWAMPHPQRHHDPEAPPSRSDAAARAMLDRVLDVMWEGDAGARLDHQARRLAMVIARAVDLDLDEADVARAGAHLVSALYDSPFIGPDPLLLAGRLAALADEKSASPEAPQGFDATERWDLHIALAALETPKALDHALVPALIKVARSAQPDPGPGCHAWRAILLLEGARVSWLPGSPVEVERAVLGWLGEPAPARLDATTAHRALTNSVLRDRAHLSEAGRTQLAALWRAAPAHLDPTTRAAVGVAAGALTAEEQLQLVASFSTLPGIWRIGLSGDLAADTAFESTREAVGESLLRMMQEAGAEWQVPAARMLLSLHRRGLVNAEVRTAIEGRLTPALRSHPKISEELRRVRV